MRDYDKAAVIAAKLCMIRGVLVEPETVLRKVYSRAELDYYYKWLGGEKRDTKAGKP